MNSNANIRKAAVFLRSLDSETSALMLGQLSTEEAASIRAAIRELGSLDPEEQADVAAEFKRSRPMTGSNYTNGVELELSTPAMIDDSTPNEVDSSVKLGRRFEFLTHASTSDLIKVLIREHTQTIAVVISHLEPHRAAAVLAELPEKLQMETIERLSTLGETDAESVTVIESELAVWLGARSENRGANARRREAVTNILAAADPRTRRDMLSKLKMRNATLAAQFSAGDIATDNIQSKLRALDSHSNHRRTASNVTNQVEMPRAEARPVHREPPVARTVARPQIAFDHLVHMDTAALNAVLREVDANVLALALAGSKDELVDRITNQMPKRTARVFRRELRSLGPTKLSDVETAQRIVADTAANYLAQRPRPIAAGVA
jgi:flagellar motor switch protein FliG